jgi:hypothetical protein
VPALGLSNPFSPISGLKPRPLQAMQFHYRAIILAHKLSPLCTTLFLLLRQSHYDYATELFLDLLVKDPLLAACESILGLPVPCSNFSVSVQTDGLTLMKGPSYRSERVAQATLP